MSQWAKVSSYSLWDTEHQSVSSLTEVQIRCARLLFQTINNKELEIDYTDLQLRLFNTGRSCRGSHCGRSVSRWWIKMFPTRTYEVFFQKLQQIILFTHSTADCGDLNSSWTSRIHPQIEIRYWVQHWELKTGGSSGDLKGFMCVVYVHPLMSHCERWWTSSECLGQFLCRLLLPVCYFLLDVSQHTSEIRFQSSVIITTQASWQTPTLTHPVLPVFQVIKCLFVQWCRLKDESQSEWFMCRVKSGRVDLQSEQVQRCWWRQDTPKV